MKTSKIFGLIGIILISLVLTTSVNANDRTQRASNKKSVTLTLDKPIIEFMAKAYADQVNASDIMRMQRMLSQIDHITISFKDADASDYVLNFRDLDEQGLEDWMFSEGYLSSGSEPQHSTIESWMLDPTYLD